MSNSLFSSKTNRRYAVNGDYILQKAAELTAATLCTNNTSKLSFIQIKGGITNLIYRVESTESDNKVLVRIYGDKTDYIINREREMAICEVLFKIGLSKNIYGCFEGGQIEEWIEGTIMSDDNVKDSIIMNGIAKTMKRLHSVPLCDKFYIKTEVEGYTSSLYKGKSFLFAKIKMLYHRVMSKSSDLKANFPEFDFGKIKLDIEVLEQICDEANSPVVLCHGDLLPANIVLTKEGIRFIDFEYSCPMERGYDIANHLMEYTGCQADWSRLPTHEEESQFLSYYLDTSSTEDIEILRDEIRPFYLASNLFWGLWGLFQYYYSNVDFCFGDYAKKKLRFFMCPEQRSKYGWITS